MAQRGTWMPWRRRASGSVLSGAVCTVHVAVNMDFDLENTAWQVLGGESSKQGELHYQMLAAIRQALGPEFDLRNMSVARGSIEILVTVGAVYYAVSRYKSLVESIELLASQLAGLVRRFLESMMPVKQLGVSASWEPGPGLIRFEVADSVPMASSWAFPLLWYLIVSHAALLALFIWLLARR